MVRIPAATYRIQFNAQFTLQDARKIVGYLHALGVSDIYASPVLRARKGSTHGYDVVDTSSINPELGTGWGSCSTSSRITRPPVTRTRGG